MNKMNRIVGAVVVAGALGFAGQGLAQSQMTGPDGLATSPRLRQQLNERPVVLVRESAACCPACNRPGATVTYPAGPQSLQQSTASSWAPGSGTAAGPDASRQPGVIASPRLQEQLAE